MDDEVNSNTALDNCQTEDPTTLASDATDDPRTYFNARTRDLSVLFRFEDQTIKNIAKFINDRAGISVAETLDQSLFVIEKLVSQLHGGYGAGFDYIGSSCSQDGEQGYFRYLLSYGVPPSEEIRFYTDPDFNLVKAEFWLCHWFQHQSFECTDDINVQAIWKTMCDNGSTEAALQAQQEKERQYETSNL